MNLINRLIFRRIHYPFYFFVGLLFGAYMSGTIKQFLPQSCTGESESVMETDDYTFQIISNANQTTFLQFESPKQLLILYVLSGPNNKYRAYTRAYRETWVRNIPKGVKVVFVENGKAWANKLFILKDMYKSKGSLFDWFMIVDHSLFVHLQDLVSFLYTRDSRDYVYIGRKSHKYMKHWFGRYCIDSRWILLSHAGLEQMTSSLDECLKYSRTDARAEPCFKDIQTEPEPLCSSGHEVSLDYGNPDPFNDNHFSTSRVLILLKEVLTNPV